MLHLGKYNIRTPAICPSIIGEELDLMRKDLEKALDLGAEIVGSVLKTVTYIKHDSNKNNI